MKISRSVGLVACALILAAFSVRSANAAHCPKTSSIKQPVKLLIVTGGHPYEPSEFFAAFNSMKDIRYVHVLTMDAKPVAVPMGGLRQYDVVLFYDMEPNAITPEWRSLLDRGKGLVFLHHAIGSFPDSPEFESISGGHANFTGQPGPNVSNSSGHANERQTFAVADREHPITCGMSDFEMIDEAYDGVDVDPRAHVLLRTSYPTQNSGVVWTWNYTDKRVLYVQMGHGSLGLPENHGPTAYQNKSFNELLHRGILWTADRL
jgi:type 1 glutamine amidotransferase